MLDASNLQITTFAIIVILISYFESVRVMLSMAKTTVKLHSFPWDSASLRESAAQLLIAHQCGALMDIVTSRLETTAWKGYI